MPNIIDHETFHADELPTVWSPVQWDLTPEEKAVELEQQAAASLLWNADTGEAILRLLLAETAIQRAYEPPDGYDPEQQGEWDENLITFGFKQPIELVEIRRENQHTNVLYKFGDLGYWEINIGPERATISRV